MRNHRWILFTSLIVLGAAGGYLLVRTADVTPDAAKTTAALPPSPHNYDSLPPTFHSGQRGPGKSHGDVEAIAKGALAGQRTIHFKDRASMAAFLENIKGKGIAVMGRLDKLNTLHIGFLDKDELAGLLDGSEKNGFVFPMQVPDLPEGSIQPGAVPLGNHLADYLNVSQYDRTEWGKNVSVAVLDTGVSLSASFAKQMSQTTLVDLPADLSTLNGHGTAVASLILQVAPDAQIISIRIADDQGQSNSSLIAQGILAAADSGAQLINISLGGFGDSQVLRDAVAYAQSKGIVIVSSAGNNGVNQITQPASLPGVVAVGGVDAKSDILLFSNSGPNLAATAPGYGVAAEGVTGGYVSFSGTSASSPIEAGVIAAAMSNNVIGSLTAAEANALVSASLDEAGAPGVDPSYGGGTVDLGRVMQSKTVGIVDAAVASEWVATTDSGQVLQVTVQNRGTAPIFNVPVTVTTSAGVQTFYAGSLLANQTQTFEVPITVNPTGSTTFQSSIGVPTGQNDVRPGNNSRKDVYTPASAQ